MKPWAQKPTGFTIVELLIVIVVIGVLAAITVVTYNSVQQRAKVARANADLRTLEKAARAARINDDETLMQITGSGCTICWDTSRYNLTLDRISAASNMNLDALKQGDPWGNPYAIDENEGENGNCNEDHLYIKPSQAGTLDIKLPLYAC